MAMLIRVNGNALFVDPKNGEHFSLEELRRYIGGGYIECVPISHEGKVSLWLVCDEDGKRKHANHETGFGLNELAQKLLGDSLRDGDYLVGDVLLCGVHEIE